MTEITKDNPKSDEHSFDANAFSFEDDLTPAFTEPKPAGTSTVSDDQAEKAQLPAFDDIFSFDDTPGVPKEENPFSFEDEMGDAFSEPQQAVTAISAVTQEEKAPLHDLDDLFLLGDTTESITAESKPLLVEEKSGKPEISGYMDCVCPKCSGRNTIEFALVPEKGVITTCSACSKKIQIIKESSVVRAKRKSFEINCASCGKQLDHNPYCPSCGALFPDFFTTLNPSDARRKARSDSLESRWTAIKELNFSFKSGTDSSATAQTYGGYSATVSTKAHKAGAPTQVSRRVVALSILLVVLVASAAAGSYFYNSYTSAKLYAENYFKVLYCMKTGIDSNLSRSAAMKAEWDAALQTGRSYSPSVIMKDDAKSASLRGQIEILLQPMSDPPGKFEQSNAKLMEIKNIYIESESLLKAKPASPQELGRKVESLTTKMGKASVELKSSIPDELQQELQTAKLKYRGLKDF